MYKHWGSFTRQNFLGIRNLCRLTAVFFVTMITMLVFAFREFVITACRPPWCFTNDFNISVFLITFEGGGFLQKRMVECPGTSAPENIYVSIPEVQPASSPYFYKVFVDLLNPSQMRHRTFSTGWTTCPSSLWKRQAWLIVVREHPPNPFICVFLSLLADLSCQRIKALDAAEEPAPCWRTAVLPREDWLSDLHKTIKCSISSHDAILYVKF